MKIKECYYLRPYPHDIAVVFPDGSAKVTPLSPFRTVREDEFRSLFGLDNLTYREKMLQDKVPEYIWRFYGFEKEGD